ncbi:hypothetical protein [Nonomuraea sp. B19D2]
MGPGQLEFLAGDRLLAEMSVPVTGSPYAWMTVAGDLRHRQKASTTCR